MWCPHDCKVGSKLETLQETVSYPSDVVHSLKKLPVLHIMDDACHFVRFLHSSHRIYIYCQHPAQTLVPSSKQKLELAAVQVAEPVTQSLDSAVQVVSFPFTYGNEPISLPNTKTQDSLAAPLHR